MQHLHWILHLSCWVQSFLSFQAPHLCTVFSNFCKLREELKVTEHYTKKNYWIWFRMISCWTSSNNCLLLCSWASLSTRGSFSSSTSGSTSYDSFTSSILLPGSVLQTSCPQPQPFYSCFSCYHVPTNNMALFSTYKCSNNPQFLHSLWERANAWNISFETLNDGQFTLST